MNATKKYLDRPARKDDCNSTPVKKSNVPINILVQESTNSSSNIVIHITCHKNTSLPCRLLKTFINTQAMDAIALNNKFGRPNAIARGHPQSSISSHTLHRVDHHEAGGPVDKVFHHLSSECAFLKDSLFHASSHQDHVLFSFDRAPGYR
jgi:hypothetical protein